MDAGALSVLNSLPRSINGIRIGMRQGADNRTPYLLGDAAHCLKVAGRSDGEPGFDYIYPQPLQLPGNLQLLVYIQSCPCRLLAVAQGGIEDYYLVHNPTLFLV